MPKNKNRESNILLSLHETESYKSNRTSMNRTLHEADNAQRILKLTADTMLLVDRNGICIDIDIHSNLWFLQEEKIGRASCRERV